MIAMIKPYSPRASAKISTRIIPTNILGSMAFALTPASPTTPMANPAAYTELLAIEIYKGRETAAASSSEVFVSLISSVSELALH